MVPKVLTVAVDKEVEETPSPQVIPVKEESKEAVLQSLSPLTQPVFSNESSSERIQLPVTLHSIIAETANDVRTGSHSKFQHILQRWREYSRINLTYSSKCAYYVYFPCC